MVNIHSNPLESEFYCRDTIDVARDLLGKRLVRQWSSGKVSSGIIVETEAYLGAKDPACHTFNYRKTAKTEAMFLPGGHSYVYFIYGMYFCFNVVTNLENEPDAVLIRALEPIAGIQEMQSHRPQALKNLSNGPGKLCQALNIDKNLNGKTLQGPEIFITDSPNLQNFNISESPRIGIGYANDAIYWPLRFCIEGNPYLSGPAKGVI